MSLLTKAPRQFASFAASSEPILKLPHPYQTAYLVTKTADANSYQLSPRAQEAGSKPLDTPLHNAAVAFSELQDLKSSDRPKDNNNTPWARARRNPAVKVTWSTAEPPTVGQLWLITYAIFTLRPSEEAFRLDAQGPGAARLARQLQTVGLALTHPAPTSATNNAQPTTPPPTPELLVSRSAFWQGAGSPFGSRPVWAPETQDPSLSDYPLPPSEYVMTEASASTALCWHPRRRAKPAPGSVIYSRWIPHLRETFSMVALDADDDAHLELFHAWQNDPRVSQGWSVTGTREQHRAYLRRANEDPHRIAMLARFDETFFAYFEVYWAKVSNLPLPPSPFSAHSHSRRTPSAPTTPPGTTTAAGTVWSATCGTAARTA